MAINLLANKEDVEFFTRKFETETMPNLKGFSTQNEELGLQKGDKVLFKNGYGIPYISEILGFDADGHAFLVWDCYWYSVNMKERLIEKLK